MDIVEPSHSQYKNLKHLFLFLSSLLLLKHTKQCQCCPFMIILYYVKMTPTFLDNVVFAHFQTKRRESSMVAPSAFSRCTRSASITSSTNLSLRSSSLHHLETKISFFVERIFRLCFLNKKDLLLWFLLVR